jgi:hypothetical protein
MALSEVVSAWAAAKPKTRMAEIEKWWEASFDADSAAEQWRRYRLASAALRPCCLLVFVMCFVGVPAVWWRFGGESWPVAGAALMLLVAMVFVAITWRRLHKKFFGDGHKRLWLNTLHLALVPTHCMRALDGISQELFANSHALAVGKDVLSEPEWKALAGAVWRRWVHCGERDPLRLAADTVVPRLKHWLSESGLSLEDVEPIPNREEGAHSYCPQCLCSFLKAESTCQDCHGVPARSFAAEE